MLKVGQTIQFNAERGLRRVVLQAGEGDAWVLDDGTFMDVGWYVRHGWARVVVPAPEDLAEGQVFVAREVVGYVKHDSFGGEYWLSSGDASGPDGTRDELASWLRAHGWALVGIRASNGEVVRLGERRFDSSGACGRVSVVVGHTVQLITEAEGEALSVHVDVLVRYWRLAESTTEAPEAPPPTLRRGAGAPPPAPVNPLSAEERRGRVRAEELRTARGVCDTIIRRHAGRARRPCAFSAAMRGMLEHAAVRPDLQESVAQGLIAFDAARPVCRAVERWELCAAKRVADAAADACLLGATLKERQGLANLLSAALDIYEREAAR